MTQTTMYAHVNKWEKKTKKNIKPPGFLPTSGKVG
jgi:hypothetical protein